MKIRLLSSYYKMNQIINKAPKIGILDNNNDIDHEINMVAYKQEKQNASINNLL